MAAKKKIKYWLDTAHYDLVSAKAMLETKRFLYVGFLCHQVVEKCKELYKKTKEFYTWIKRLLR